MKILVRCGMLPFEKNEVEKIIELDSIGTNSGNLLFQHSVIKALSVNDNEIFSDRYRIDLNEAQMINDNYDCYVLPMADAFRTDFIGNLRKYTQLINQLNIPVYVIGIGLRTEYSDTTLKFTFDEDVKEFVRAVVNTGTCIGVRGRITGEYLERLGFQEYQDFVIIGCPSMYSKGAHLTIRQLNLSKASVLCLNGNRITNDLSWAKMYQLSNAFNSSYFIPQEYDELFLTYAGGPSIDVTTSKFPADYQSSFYKEGRVRFFLEAIEWYKFMGDADYSIGSRIHGNIAATLGGAPSLTIAIDSRMRELAEFHSLPYVSECEFLEIDNLIEYISSIDYTKAVKKHKANFENFKAFLKNNNLAHIYELQDYNEELDTKISETESIKFLEPITKLDNDLLIKHLQFSMDFRKRKFEVSKENWSLYKKMKEVNIFR